MTIFLGLRIRNPFSNRWESVYEYYSSLTKNKCFEFQICKDNSIFEFEISKHWRIDHTPLIFMLGALGWVFELSFYDCRHWDDDKCCYEGYEVDPSLMQMIADEKKKYNAG